MSQHCGEPLSSYFGTNSININEIKQIAFQMLSALTLLHSKMIVHRNLCPENVLVQPNKDIKLFNYGLYYMTDYGRLVPFPIM